jgi:hypothetical protein
MKQDKFLTGILIGIGVLIVLALALFFIRKDTKQYTSDDTPEGVVYNYLLAVFKRDYEKAYTYLADLKNKPTYEEFRKSFFNGNINPGDAGVDVGTVELNGDEAIVIISVVHAPSDPFSGGYENTDRALLVKQGGKWKLSAMPAYSFWDYNWYTEPFKEPFKP